MKFRLNLIGLVIGLFVVIIFLWVIPQYELNQVQDVESYVACGCGCCGGEEPKEEVCLYHSKGDDIRKIILEDRKTSQNEICKFVGCLLGIKYVYCG